MSEESDQTVVLSRCSVGAMSCAVLCSALLFVIHLLRRATRCVRLRRLPLASVLWLTFAVGGWSVYAPCAVSFQTRCLCVCVCVPSFQLRSTPDQPATSSQRRRPQVCTYHRASLSFCPHLPDLT